MRAQTSGSKGPCISLGGGGRIRVVLDSTPGLKEPVTRVEQKIPSVGWCPVVETQARLAGEHKHWTCWVEAVDENHDYSYDVELEGEQSPEQIGEILKRYASDLLDGVDCSKVSKLTLIAIPVS